MVALGAAGVGGDPPGPGAAPAGPQAPSFPLPLPLPLLPAALRASEADEFSPTRDMQDMVMGFLIRVLFLLSDTKDEETSIQHTYALNLVRDALQLWPNVSGGGGQGATCGVCVGGGAGGDVWCVGGGRCGATGVACGERGGQEQHFRCGST